jgi:transposase
MDLTEQQWQRLAPLLPKERKRQDGKGRPWRDPRDVLNAILWILRTGAPWRDLPSRYPPFQTCHRRFQKWVREGVFEKIVKALAEDLRERGRIDLSEAFVDGTFASAKKGVLALVRRNAARGPRSWPLQTALVFLSPLPSRRPRRTKRSSSNKR